MQTTDNTSAAHRFSSQAGLASIRGGIGFASAPVSPVEATEPDATSTDEVPAAGWAA